MHTTQEKRMPILGRILLVILIFAVLLGVLAYVVLFRLNRFSLEVRLNGDREMSMAVGEDFPDPGADIFLRGTLFLRDGYPVEGQITIAGQVDPSVPGTYYISYDGSWRNLNTAVSRQVTVEDRTAPEITLISDPGHYTIPGEDYVEEGFSVWDDCDGDLTAYVTRIQEDGYVTYTVADQAGNRTSVMRKIYYYDPISPEITLLGEATMYVTAGAGFTDPGCKATDNGDGDISDRVTVTGEPDKYLAGSYEITYTVKDSTGNESCVTRTVVVEPKGIPQTMMPEGKVIYLTFDDGPGPYTRELLRVLEKYGAKATFFVVDSGYDELIKEIVEGGHSIGIHSVTHEYKSIYASADAYFQDLLTMQQLIYELTGVETYLMRFPGGSSNTVSSFNPGIMTYLTEAVQDNGFQYFDWNVDSNDAGGAKKAAEVFENVKAGVENRRVSIVLQHDIKAFSVEAVEKILKWGLENGYQFLALDMSSPNAHHGVNN